MKLEIASWKAIKYACLNFHYAKSIPVNVFGFSVFNGGGVWCGVILYGKGATPHIATPYGLKQGQVIELVRMALNGKQESTSKAMAISMKLLHKKLPLCKLLVSFADIDQNHTGVIYQATNWIYQGEFGMDTLTGYMINGKKTHNKSIFSKLNPKGLTYNLENVRKHLDKNATQFISKGKRKYIYPIDKKMIPLCMGLSKPYPKKLQAREVNLDKHGASSSEIGGSNPTLALK